MLLGCKQPKVDTLIWWGNLEINFRFEARWLAEVQVPNQAEQDRDTPMLDRRRYKDEDEAITKGPRGES